MVFAAPTFTCFLQVVSEQHPKIRLNRGTGGADTTRHDINPRLKTQLLPRCPPSPLALSKLATYAPPSPPTKLLTGAS